MCKGVLGGGRGPQVEGLQEYAMESWQHDFNSDLTVGTSPLL